MGYYDRVFNCCMCNQSIVDDLNRDCGAHYTVEYNYTVKETTVVDGGPATHTNTVTETYPTESHSDYVCNSCLNRKRITTIFLVFLSIYLFFYIIYGTFLSGYNGTLLSWYNDSVWSNLLEQLFPFVSFFKSLFNYLSEMQNLWIGRSLGLLFMISIFIIASILLNFIVNRTPGCLSGQRFGKDLVWKVTAKELDGLETTTRYHENGKVTETRVFKRKY